MKSCFCFMKSQYYFKTLTQMSILSTKKKKYFQTALCQKMKNLNNIYNYLSCV